MDRFVPGDRKSPPSLSFRTIILLLCCEAAFAMVFETWLGATYLTGLAGKLNIDIVLVTIITSMPWVGAFGQLFGRQIFSSRFFRDAVASCPIRGHSLKKYTVRLALAARALWFIPIGLAALWCVRAVYHDVPFPFAIWFLTVTITATAAGLIGSFSGVAWNSWMRTLVPGRFHSRFFGLRNRYIMVSLAAANLVACLFINYTSKGLPLGFFGLAAAAVIAAMASTYLLARVPDSKTSLEPLSRDPFLLPLSDKAFRKVLIFGALFNGAIFFNSPYFSYYFTRDLGVSLSTIAAWGAVTNFGNFIAAAYWARRCDGEKSILRTLAIGGYVVSLSPLAYVFPNAQAVYWVAPLEYLLNGMAWAGYTIALTTLVFQKCPPGKSTSYFSLYAAASGLAGAAGTFLGGHTARLLEHHGGFRSLWVIGTVARIAVLWALLPALRSIPTQQGDRRKRSFWRFVVPKPQEARYSKPNIT
jgi:hypothetical protein